MELKQLFERTTEIRAATPSTSVRQRLAEVATDISKAGDNQARVELLNEALLAVTKLCYEVDADNYPANIDSRTHRLLIPAPWGKSGWRKWQLREWEATILRKILIMRGEMRRVAPVFDYNNEMNQWYLNASAYPRLDSAFAYWKANPITLRDFRLFADIYRQEAQARMARRRSGSQ